LDGANGIKFEGIAAQDDVGTSVADAGDVNGDGFSDNIIGAPSVDGPGGYLQNAGEVYVIFGSGATQPASIDLASLDGADGFRLNGIDAFEGAGTKSPALVILTAMVLMVCLLVRRMPMQTTATAYFLAKYS
jgi:hypothetical protein